MFSFSSFAWRVGSIATSRMPSSTFRKKSKSSRSNWDKMEMVQVWLRVLAGDYSQHWGYWFSLILQHQMLSPEHVRVELRVAHHELVRLGTAGVFSRRKLAACPVPDQVGWFYALGLGKNPPS